MNVSVFLGLLSLLGAASLWLGRNTSGKSRNHDDYFLMGRKLGLFSLIMTLLATQIGGGALLGASEEAFYRGWNVLFYPLGMVIGFLVLGFGYGAKIRKLNLTTIPEIFEKIYGSSELRKIASLLSIVSLFFILVGQAIAARKFFLSLGFYGDFLFVLFWGILILYTTIGGLKAVVKTDILQTLFILTSFSIVIITALCNGSVIKSASLNPPEHMFEANSTTPWLTWLLMPLLFMLIEQDMGQRCFAAKNPKTVSIAAIISALLLLATSLVPIFFGTMAAKLGIEIEPGSSVLISAVKTMTNPTVSTILICAILMAIISTADSLLCSLSSNIACDFPKLGKSILASQAITLLIGLTTLGLAFTFDNVLAMLMFSYKLAVSVLFVPVTLAVWTKAPQKNSAALSMTMGSSCFLLLQLLPTSFPSELVALGCSFLGFGLSEGYYKWKAKNELC